jgi:L-galactose dehydrogenase
MERRRLGRTGAEVSVLAFGGSPLGGVFGRIDESEAAATVHAAIDAGINYFDVAPYYGNAEEVLGRALGSRRDEVILATKAGRYPDGFDFSRSRIIASVEESLRRLRTDHLDVLIAHDIEFGDLDRILDETYSALLELKQAGKCRWIGMSGYPLPALRRVMAAPHLDMLLAYCHLCLCDTSLAEGLAPHAAMAGVGLISASPLSMGLLTDEGPPAFHPASEELRAAARKAAAWCRARGVSLSRLALQFAVDEAARRGVTATLVGMADRRVLQSNLDALNGARYPESTEAVRSIFAAVAERTWATGRPENS